jgi:hypothetical protein
MLKWFLGIAVAFVAAIAFLGIQAFGRGLILSIADFIGEHFTPLEVAAIVIIIIVGLCLWLRLFHKKAAS